MVFFDAFDAANLVNIIDNAKSWVVASLASVCAKFKPRQ